MQLDTGNRYLKKRDENNILTVGMEKTPYKYYDFYMVW